VGEVRRGVQRNMAGVGSNATSPAPRYRRHASQRSETHGAIAASALRRINQLEERNRALARMMDGAVRELWECHEWLVGRGEKGGDATAKGKEEGEPAIEKQQLDKFSVAVARIQFVQAFLKDLTLPLPEDTKDDSKADEKAIKEDGKATKENEKEVEETNDIRIEASAPIQINKAKESLLSTSPKPIRGLSSPPTDKPQIYAPQPKRSSATPITKKPPWPSIQISQPPISPSPPTEPPELPTLALSPPPSTKTSTNLPLSAPSLPPPSPPDHSSTTLKPRPRLTESSFSWMLTGSAGDAHGPSFARATPFAPHEKRSQVAAANPAAKAKAGKGFLFGEESGEDGNGLGRRGSGSSAKGKKSREGGGGLEEIGMGDVG
jgi:TBC1 domain family member 5